MRPCVLLLFNAVVVGVVVGACCDSSQNVSPSLNEQRESVWCVCDVCEGKGRRMNSVAP